MTQLTTKRVSLLPSVKGSLLAHKLWWNNNISNVFVLNIINNGYEIPFTAIPGTSFIKNNKSARDHPEFVSAEIKKLLESGIINEHKHPPPVVNPLTVAENAVGKLRLVLD